MKDKVHQLNQRILEQIPLTGGIGLEIASYDGRELIMTAPLAPNRNDKGTGFAGSIAALATLAGWALVTLGVEERRGPAEVAICRSEIDYLRPITADFCARCRLPEEEALQDLLADLDQKGRGRLKVAVVVEQKQTQAVIFSGTYVVRLRPCCP
ncbi:MAG: YiiD C-terminal domain-containing protein [Syntrophotaleaceae bacterium]